MQSILTNPFVLFLILLWTLLGESIPLESGKQDLEDRTWILDWEPPENIKNKFLYYVSGFDYDNKPILVMEWGKWDFEGVAEKGGEDLENAIIILDQLIDRIQVGYFANNNSESVPGDKEIVVIVDFGGLKLRQIRSPPTFQLLLDRMAKMGTTSKCVAYGFIVNANPLVHQVINLVKPFIGNFLEKIEIFGTNSHKWMPFLLKKIPRGELHAEYGGYKDFKPVAVYG